MDLHIHDRGDQKKHGGMKHGVGMMLLCCGIPVAAFLLLPLVGVRLGGALSTLLILACPLSHVLMMAFMGKERGHGSHDPAATLTKEPVPEVIDDVHRMLLPAPRERD